MLNALWMVLLGMGMIFAVLGVLFLVMIALSRAVSNKEKEREPK